EHSCQLKAVQSHGARSQYDAVVAFVGCRPIARAGLLRLGLYEHQLAVEHFSDDGRWIARAGHFLVRGLLGARQRFTGFDNLTKLSLHRKDDLLAGEDRQHAVPRDRRVHISDGAAPPALNTADFVHEAGAGPEIIAIERLVFGIEIVNELKYGSVRSS